MDLIGLIQIAFEGDWPRAFLSHERKAFLDFTLVVGWNGESLLSNVRPSVLGYTFLFATASDAAIGLGRTHQVKELLDSRPGIKDKIILQLPGLINRDENDRPKVTSLPIE